MTQQTIHISNPDLTLGFEAGQGLTVLSAGGEAWLPAGSHSGLFGLMVDGRRYDAAGLRLEHTEEITGGQGKQHLLLTFSGPGFTVRQHLIVYQDTALLEQWPVIENTGAQPILVERVDSIDLTLAAGPAELLYYTGDWGSEFEPHVKMLDSAIQIDSRAGRASKGHHPWFALTQPGGQVLSASVAWSGNWVFRFEPVANGAVQVTGGLHNWQFSKRLAPGEAMEAPPVVLVLGRDLNAVSQQYASVGRRHWYPRTPLSARAPIEWNHWWPYEDVEINETVFARNVEAASPMGFEVCTLDAGWFGPSDAGTFWEHYRGDWSLVNNDRFPSGLRALADQVHARGMAFGIWCEIEGLGEKAQVAIDHPEYVALRDGKRIGCMCFGSPAVQDWAFETLSRLITEYKADWIKLDSNFDPGAGCNRTDHGHQAGDGLYEHMRGYYRTLERLRAAFPKVVLENCSSGGLRIDLGMLRRTDMTFLSDPDWPVHDLQIFWGASTMLAPDALLHWPFGDWRNTNPPPQQNFNPHDPNLTREKWDYCARMSMLGLFGVSQKLPNLPAWLRQRMTEHNQLYKQHVRRFVQQADLYRLTSQPLRSGAGERWTAFQYHLPEPDEHLLFVFRLPGGEASRAVRLLALQPERVYQIEGLEGEFSARMSGRQLMDSGLLFAQLPEEGSALLKIQPI